MIFAAISRRILARSVRHGARYLDRARPGWDQAIDLDRLSVATYDRCVLGQLHPGGGYQHGLATLGMSSWQTYRCGFDLFPLIRWPSWRLFGSRSGFAQLDECWRELIRARRVRPA